MIKYLNTTQFGNLPVRISYYALKMFKATTGKDFMLGKESTLEMVDFEPLLFYSLEKGHQMANRPFTYMKNGVETKFDLNMIADVLDEVLFEFIALIPEFFPKGKKKNEPQTDEEKKEIPMQ